MASAAGRRTRPRTFESTSRSASRGGARPGGRAARLRVRPRAPPTSSAQENGARLTRLCSATPLSTAAWIFSYTRGTDGKWVGRTSASSSTIRFGSPPQNASVPPTSSATLGDARERVRERQEQVDHQCPSPSSSSASYIATVASRCPCVITQPFGGPVVPDV